MYIKEFVKYYDELVTQLFALPISLGRRVSRRMTSQGQQQQSAGHTNESWRRCGEVVEVKFINFSLVVLVRSGAAAGYDAETRKNPVCIKRLI